MTLAQARPIRVHLQFNIACVILLPYFFCKFHFHLLFAQSVQCLKIKDIWRIRGEEQYCVTDKRNCLHHQEFQAQTTNSF